MSVDLLIFILIILSCYASYQMLQDGPVYEGCSLVLVIDSFSPKPSFIPEENYLLVEEWFFAILKSPNYFKMIDLIMAN